MPLSLRDRLQTGNPCELLKIYHYVFLDYNPLFAKSLLDKCNCDFYGKTDSHFIDAMYKVSVISAKRKKGVAWQPIGHFRRCAITSATSHRLPRNSFSPRVSPRESCRWHAMSSLSFGKSLRKSTCSSSNKRDLAPAQLEYVEARSFTLIFFRSRSS